jgi:hypothetical protein
MAIEIVPKPALKIPFSLNILFFLSAILLLSVISGYFVLLYLEKKVSFRIEEVGSQITSAKTSEEIYLENEIKIKKKKIEDFSKSVGERKFPSKFFGFSEEPFSETKNFGKLIHPKVQISSFSLNVKDSKVNISGLTENFTTLEQQFIIFQKESLIKEVNLSGISPTAEGKINFNFDISFYPDFLK